MLLDEISNSKELAMLYKSSSIAEDYLQDLRHVLTKLNEYKSSIIKLYESVNVINAAGKSGITDQEYIGNHLKELKDQLSQMNSNNIMKELQFVIDFYKRVEEQTKRAWAQYRADHFSKNDNMIRTLSNVITDNDQKLDQLGKLREIIIKTSLGNAQLLNQITTYEQLSQDVILSLHMDDSIESFVMKLAKGEDIFLSDLDDNGKILSWLKNHHLLSKISLSL